MRQERERVPCRQSKHNIEGYGNELERDEERRGEKSLPLKKKNKVNT